MDNFNKTYKNILEQLDSSLLAANNGMYGGALHVADTWNTGDNRLAAPYVLATRNGRRKLKNKSRKKKKAK